MGGSQSLHVDSYDEAYSVPSEEAALISLRTQQIIEAETGITEVVDPLGGSFYLESLTNDIENKILDEIDEIERIGGLVEAVEKGWVHQRVISHINREHKMITDGTIKVVGRNYFKTHDGNDPPIYMPHHDEESEGKIRQRLFLFRKSRNGEAVSCSLDDLKRACEKGGNVMEQCLKAVRAGATEGEMRRAFLEALGPWKPPLHL